MPATRQNLMDELTADKYNIQELNDYINQLEAIKVTLQDENGTIIASSVPEFSDLNHYSFFSVDTANRKVYFTFTVQIFKDDGVYLLNIFYNITLLIIEILFLGAALVFLFLVSILTIYIRGKYLTRKAFAVVDELIVKAKIFLLKT